MTKTNQEADKGEGMSDVNKKAAEILVECGYAQKYEPYGACFRVIVYYTIKLCNPFLDTLEGRRQADAIEDFLWYHHSGLSEDIAGEIPMVSLAGGVTNQGIVHPPEPASHYKWRLKWLEKCLEQLAIADKETPMNNTNDDELIEEIGNILVNRDCILSSGTIRIDYEGSVILYSDIQEIIALIRSKENDGWVSVESHLPREKGLYDVWLFHRRETNQWFNGKVFVNPSITHWRKPQPPIEKDADNE